MSEIPEELKPWIAEEGQEPTTVSPPLFIDYRAAKDLFAYHPGFLDTQEYRMRHVARIDDDGSYYVATDSLSKNWDEKLRAIEESLKLYLQTDSLGNDYLLDDKVQGPTMHGWEVTKWTVVKNIDSDGNNIHQDLITWEKDDLEILSLYSWRPY